MDGEYSSHSSHDNGYTMGGGATAGYQPPIPATTLTAREDGGTYKTPSK
jgi:hypothetical protein